MTDKIEKKSWKEFKTVGLLWFVNMFLHAFGWAIVCVIDKEGEVAEAYPARVKFRGFSESTNEQGYIRLSDYLKDNIEDIAKEAKE